MAIDYFLNISGIHGDSMVDGFEGSLEVSSVSFSFANPFTLGVGGGGGASQPDGSDVSLHFGSEAGVTAFLDAVDRGTVLDHASLVGVSTSHGDEAPREEYRLNLAQVHVTSIQQSGAEDSGGYDVTLSYSAFVQTVTTTRVDGSPGTPQVTGWDFLHNTPTSTSTNVAAPGASVNADVPTPTHYYMLVDGVNGGSTDEGHEGWFDLGSFSLGASNTGAGGAGAGGSHPTGEDVQVSLAGPGPGDSGLLADVLSGHAVRGVRIEGVANDREDNPAVVYKLDLVAAHLTADSVSASGGGDGAALSLSIDYSAYSLSTFGENPNTGTLSTPLTVSYDFAKGTAGGVAIPSISPSGGGGAVGGHAPNQYFLNITGFHGDSAADGFEGSLQVESVSFGFTNPVIVGGGGGAGVGKPQGSDVNLHFGSEAGVTAFVDALDKGTLLDHASLVGVSSSHDGELTEEYRLNLAQLHVTSIQQSGSDHSGGYDVTLSYDAFVQTVATTRVDGTPGTPQVTGWDFTKNIATTTSTNVSAPGGAVNADIPTPAHYYMLVDGVNGGSTDVGHVGWFDLGSFSLGATNPDTTGPAGASPPTGTDVTVNLVGPGAGDSGLLADVLSGRSVRGVRIEGVTLDRDDNPAVVYKLDLVTAHLTGDSLSATGGDSGALSLSIGYTAYSLSTFGENPDGTLSQPLTVSYNFTQGVPDTVVVPTISPGGGGVSGHASNEYFLNITGFHGDSMVQGFEGSLQVESISFGVSNSGAPGGGGGGASKPDGADVSLHFGSDAAVTTFLDALDKGTLLDSASLVGVSTDFGDGQEREQYRLNLSQVHVTSIQQSGSDHNGGYDVTLSYDTFVQTVATTRVDGTPGTPQVTGWDFTRNVTTTASSNVAAPGNAVNADIPTPAHYYMLVDGVNGGSTDVGHEGWFDLGSFSLGASNAGVPTGGGAGASHPTGQEVTVSLAGPGPGDSGLLTDLLNGRSVRGVRIEGVADDRDDNPAVVYKLDLVTAHLTADAVSAAGGDSGALSLSIGYNAYALSTFGQNPDTGILSPPVIRSYDFFKGVADAVVIPSISPGSDGNGPPPVPAVPSSLALDASADSGVQGDHLTNAAHLVIDGITSANANVTIHDGAVVVGSGTADASGVFVISTTDLAEGLHGLTATANFTGGASSASSSSLPITIDRTAPGAPTGLHLDAATDTGTLGDGVTAATVLKIDGSAEAGSTVTLSEGGVTLGTAVADGTTGAFQVTTSALAAGSHSFTATATDAAGNPGVASSPLVVTLNTLSFPADTGTHTGSELAGVTGSASPDTVNAALSFTDNDATAHHSVGVGATATLALSSGAVPAGLASALAGLASATVTEPAGGGAGAVNATFQAPDKLFDFLGQGQSLTVSYSLSLSSDHGGTVSEPVTFTITGANDAPTAAPDTATVAEEATVTINVLGNDTDPDQGDHLHLATASGPAGSALSIVNDQLVFTPGDGFDSLTAGQSATTTLSYTVHDDAGVTSSSSVTLTVTGVADGTPFTGGTTNDSHAGGNTDDKFDGGAGDDTLSGGGGADTLIGGVGNDSLAGGNGPDSLTGGTGNDIMTGGDGDDVLNGGTGRDLMTGGAGADKFVFSLTADSTVALTGQDEILDFNAAEGDKLNVVAIGAHTAGGLKFVTAFTHTLGQLIEVDQHNGTYLIEADVNGDGNADFAVLVHAGAPLLASDFILA